MRRMNWKTVSTLITMITIAGCQENVSSPTLAPSASTARLSAAPQGRPQPALSLSGDAGSLNGSTDFSVGPSGGLFYTGSHAVYFPAGSICDPSSSYGPGTWDDACEPLRSTITVHADVRTTAAGTSVDFSPSLRFTPSSVPSRWVWMYMYTPQATNYSGDLSRFTILYAAHPGDVGIDESIGDPTLRTYVDTRSGISLRRIKHFSGYTVSTRCSDVITENCTTTDDPITTTEPAP
jgi:hypothetical protein